ncbi:hypothetical protein ACN27F_10835 [Solwaraspora sp. WMMB335]|uniref:hypothetical protein n=1 Tax=Solwaraspora sp. WMMB335 TaxID=3404118 RepID=UPI003B958860
MRVTAVLITAAALLAGTATPAAAHGADAPAATDYRVSVTGISPAVDGLTVRVIEAGARLELANHTGRPIEVLGYGGEPYLEIRPTGVFENLRSPTTYQNRTLAGDTAVPDTADPTAPPAWQRVSDEPVARWHDQRTYWLGDALPAAVQAEPDRPHQVRQWSVPLRDGVTPFEVRGTLDWIPPPDPSLWWAGTLLGAVLLTAGLLAADRRGRDAAGRRSAGGRPTGAGRLAAGLLGAAGLVAIGYVVARAFDAGAAGPLELASALARGPVWALLSGVAAVAAAGYAASRAGGDFGLALAGTCLAIFAGAGNAAVFTRAVAPVPGPALWPRLTVAAVLACGTAVAVAAVLRLRARVPRAGAPHRGDPTSGQLTDGEVRVEADR